MNNAIESTIIYNAADELYCIRNNDYLFSFFYSLRFKREHAMRNMRTHVVVFQILSLMPLSV